MENGQATAFRANSVHLRLKYLHEERDSLQSICQVLESLYNFWRDMMAREGDEGMDGSGVSAVEDLRMLWREFSSQLQSRGELLNRLNNLQSLVRRFPPRAGRVLVLTLVGVCPPSLQYFNLSASRIAQSSKRDNTAMKTIAIVTSVFLPATFVAVSRPSPFQMARISTYWEPLLRDFLEHHFLQLRRTANLRLSVDMDLLRSCDPGFGADPRRHDVLAPPIRGLGNKTGR